MDCHHQWHYLYYHAHPRLERSRRRQDSRTKDDTPCIWSHGFSHLHRSTHGSMVCCMCPILGQQLSFFILHYYSCSCRHSVLANNVPPDCEAGLDELEAVVPMAGCVVCFACGFWCFGLICERGLQILFSRKRSILNVSRPWKSCLLKNVNRLGNGLALFCTGRFDQGHCVRSIHFMILSSISSK